MAETSKSKVSFPKGIQRQFLLMVESRLQIKRTDIVELLGVSGRTYSDWKREKFLIPLESAKLLSRKAEIELPKHELKEKYWYTKIGAVAGGINCFEKYGRVGGDELSRKKKWREWWHSVGKFSPHPIIGVSKKINKPEFSPELAEMIGIFLGDGGISQFQVVVTLHRIDDAEYSEYVQKLIKKLFGVEASLYEEKDALANNICVSRRELVKYLTDVVGLKVGNKVTQQVEVPQWIIGKMDFRKACLRGLVDTDGCLIIHKYKVNGKLYTYKKLGFSNSSKPLVDFVHSTLNSIGIRARIAKQGTEVRVDGIEDMKKYFSVISSNNQKHLRRWLK